MISDFIYSILNIFVSFFTIFILLLLIYKYKKYILISVPLFSWLINAFFFYIFRIFLPSLIDTQAWSDMIITHGIITILYSLIIMTELSDIFNINTIKNLIVELRKLWKRLIWR